MAATLTIGGANGPYPVVIRRGALVDALPEFVREHAFSRVAVITNTTVGPLYAADLTARLPGAFVITVPDGEQHKTLDTVAALYGELLGGGCDRSSLVIGLGGGVIGDMAGFVAATFMRGVAFVQAPTSLLAMVDASLGSKVGVDLPQGKNLAGAFKDPLGVFADTSTLATLPDVEFRCGLAEVLKAGLIADPGLVDDLLAYNLAPIENIITRAVQVKKRIVEQDRLESGVRAYLNLGHTFAHAIEQVSGYAWKHGEAVAVGLVAAARLSERCALATQGLAARVEQAVATLGLPVRFAGLEPATLWDTMRHDKKWRGGTARFVLLKGMGESVIADDVSHADVIAVLEELREW